MRPKTMPSWIPDRLHSVAESAELLRLSVRQTQRLISDGRLRVLRIGRRVLIQPEAIAALIDESRSDDAK